MFDVFVLFCVVAVCCGLAWCFVVVLGCGVCCVREFVVIACVSFCVVGVIVLILL